MIKLCMSRGIHIGMIDTYYIRTTACCNILIRERSCLNYDCLNLNYDLILFECH